MNIKCSKCDNGTVYECEDGREVSGVCYHCSGSGMIDDDLAHHDRMMDLAKTLAYKHIQDMKRACNDDPDGEGWEFAAAENMMSEEEYTKVRMYDFTFHFASQLSKLDRSLQDALLSVSQ